MGFASKDPARPENFALGKYESVHGARLVSVEWGVGPARVTVSRGTDEFTFTFVRASDTASVPVLVLDPGAGSVVAAVGAESRPAEPPAAGSGLRLVGYLGPDGALAGVRVTGIETTSAFAAAGVRRGDAILEFDGKRIDGASAFSKQWNEGWRPKEALVLALDQPGAKPTRIKFGS